MMIDVDLCHSRKTVKESCWTSKVYRWIVADLCWTTHLFVYYPVVQSCVNNEITYTDGARSSCDDGHSVDPLLRPHGVFKSRRER